MQMKTKLEGVCNLLLFEKMGQPRPLLSFIFGLFKQTSLQFLQQIYVKKCPSSIQCRDSNPQPLEHASPPITTIISYFLRKKQQWSGLVVKR